MARNGKTVDAPRTAGLREARPDRRASIALAVFLAAVFLARCLAVSGHLDMGGDIATYLSTADAFFGQDPTGFGLDRPPLIAPPLRLFTLVLGDLAGVKALGIFFSVALAIPFYLLARRVSHQWVAAVTAVLFVLTPVYSDMLTWGYITMAGLLFGLLTIHFLLSVLDRPSMASVFFAGLCASFIAGFHQLSLAFFVPLFLLVAAALLALNRPVLRQRAGAAAAAMALAVVLSLPYVPLYIKILGLQAPAGPQPMLSLSPSSWPWIAGPIALLPLLVPTLKWTLERHRNTAIVTAVMLLYSLALMVLRLPPPFVELNRRAHYFMCPAAWLLAAVVMSQLWSWSKARLQGARRWIPRGVAGAGTAALLSVMMVLSQTKLSNGLDFFTYLDETRRDAVMWLEAESLPGASVACYPETLGWWVEAEAGRNTLAVTDRDTVPYSFLQDRSLAAERILSRNQGLENGLLRLATTYPCSGAPGQPVVGAFAGGSYRDILMFDDREVRLTMPDGRTRSLASNSRQGFTVTGNGDSMTMTTSWDVAGVQVVQTSRLDRGSRTALVSYTIDASAAPVERLALSILFAHEPSAVNTARDGHGVEVEQDTGGPSGRVCTGMDIQATGASVAATAVSEGRLDLSLDIQNARSTAVFSFAITDPVSTSEAGVVHYEVPLILAGPALEHITSVDYIAVDRRPNPHLAGALPGGTEEWLDACPYYRLAHSEGDVRIYEVVTAALP